MNVLELVARLENLGWDLNLLNVCWDLLVEAVKQDNIPLKVRKTVLRFVDFPQHIKSPVFANILSTLFSHPANTLKSRENYFEGWALMWPTRGANYFKHVKHCLGMRLPQSYLWMTCPVQRYSYMSILLVPIAARHKGEAKNGNKLQIQ